MRTPTDTKIPRSAGRAIERARKARKLSARALAAEVEMDFGYLRRVEKGQSASLATYARLAAALGLDLGALLTVGRSTRGAR